MKSDAREHETWERLLRPEIMLLWSKKSVFVAAPLISGENGIETYESRKSKLDLCTGQANYRSVAVVEAVKMISLKFRKNCQ